MSKLLVLFCGEWCLMQGSSCVERSMCGPPAVRVVRCKLPLHPRCAGSALPMFEELELWDVNPNPAPYP